MLVGQQIGPFLIEKEIGAGAMGAVYRGKYVKTGQVVAVKVMAPGVGGTSGSQAGARFERESKILKQLNHPNIVRLFGVGKHHGMPYYAMEFVQGESLDRVMSRRDRMTWEEVVDLGQQLCSALQHAHEAGIVHRDLKPSNLMILADGTLKLTDFGIAKDLDVTALTGANCTVGTAAYMSPEQCKGDPHLTHKSDLYSLGVVLYELVTGRKPFTAENAMDMFLQHVNATPERPSRMVMDVPVWLDTLICQLLEKKPDQRPFDAAMVARALAGIQEKVEAQQSAGVEAVKARLGDRPRGQRRSNDEDKDAARTLLGKKGKRKKKGMSPALIAAQAVGIVLALAAIVAVVVIALQPPPAERLYQRAEKLMANEEDWEKAQSGPIKDYLRHYGKRDDERTQQVRKWSNQYEVREFQKLMDKHVRHKTGKASLGPAVKNDGEKAAFAAALAEHEGKREEAKKLWEEALEAEGGRRVMVTAEAHLKELARIDETVKTFAKHRQYLRDWRTEPTFQDEYERSAFLAWRQEELGDRAGAQRAYESLRESASKDARQRYWVLFAAVQASELSKSLGKKGQSEKERVEAVQQVVEAAQGAMKVKKIPLLDVRVPLQDVVTLYEKDEDMAAPVKLAKKLISEIDSKLPRR
jgi:serine/threonine-protein kinase